MYREEGPDSTKLMTRAQQLDGTSKVLKVWNKTDEEPID